MRRGICIFRARDKGATASGQMIPPSSPLYNLTYVQVYGSTPTVVYTGYTPGYTGAYVSDGCIVYGTGYGVFTGASRSTRTTILDRP